MTAPWYERVSRWGQTNLTEIDPVRYDSDWWRGYWRRTRIGGVIVNAGGIVAYYPSRYPQHRAIHLNERDLFGEITAAAHADGLAVIARMDSNRADEQLYNAHPDWFAVDGGGQPYRAGSRYVACINSPYYEQFLPGVLREIIERSQPEGFGDNSWSGLDRTQICYCGWCAARFREAAGLPLPARVDWDDPAYCRWIAWGYERRTEIWDLNNRVTQEAGGADCLWIGMNAGDLVAQSHRLRDYRALCSRAKMILLDSQWRHDEAGFQANAQAGQLIHGLVGWNRLIPESTALYAAGQPSFRLTSKPETEVRLWAVEGFAGGIQPWWHVIGARHEDRRQYRTAESLFAWHEAHESYLRDRTPVATVGIVWSQANVDFYGRESPAERVMAAHRGIANALLRARIPWVPVHADDITDQAAGLRLLILPALGVMTDPQCKAIQRFTERGGSVIASGESSLYDERGQRRADFGLADVLRVHATVNHHGSSRARGQTGEWERHSYLRLSPELYAETPGTRSGQDQPATRHPALDGFEGTDLLPFGGRLEVVTAEPDATALATFVPPFPIYPPETAWMAQPRTSVPALVVSEHDGGARVAYLAADIDRCFGRDRLPDLGRLLASLVRWAVRDDVPIEVQGLGRLDCRLYRQQDHLILHIVNLTGADGVHGPVDEIVPIGPLQVRVRTRQMTPAAADLLVAGGTLAVERQGDWVSFQLEAVDEHEVAVIRADRNAGSQ